MEYKIIYIELYYIIYYLRRVKMFNKNRRKEKGEEVSVGSLHTTIQTRQSFQRL